MLIQVAGYFFYSDISPICQLLHRYLDLFYYVNIIFCYYCFIVFIHICKIEEYKKNSDNRRKVVE